MLAPDRTRRTTPARVAAVALGAVAALALAGCSGGSSPSGAGTPSTSVSSPSMSPSPTSTVSVPSGVALTAEGSKLAFGDSARVVDDNGHGKGTVLQLKVLGARHAARSDFANFILDDPYKKQAHYYYVRVQVKNVGQGDVGGTAVPLWGVDGGNTLLPVVSFTTRFKPCASTALPRKFGPGAATSTCLVYLSPRHGSLAAVSFRPDQAFNPITWTGTVEAAQQQHKKSKKH